jgi:hypothetical protein
VVEIEPQRRERYLNGRAMHFCPSVPRNYLYHSEEDAADHATHSRASMLKHYFSGFEECLVECNPLKPSLLELARQAFSRRQSNALMCRGAQIVPASDLQTLDDHLLEDREFPVSAGDCSGDAGSRNNVLVTRTSFPEFVQDLSCALSLPPYIFFRAPLRARSCCSGCEWRGL